MTPHFMLRSFDHAWYYETRTLLMLAAVAVALYFYFKKRDSRYLVMFLSGVLFQGLMEWYLQSGGARGAGYEFSVFGVRLSGIAGNVYQGLAEGGIFAIMAFWFVDLRTSPENDPWSARAYATMCVVIVVLACVVGLLAAGQPITSPRPMAAGPGMIRLYVTVAASLLLVPWRKHGYRYLGLFYLGLLIYTVITFETLHLFGARYIGLRSVSGGGFMAAPMADQVIWMLYSHLVEVAAGKIHYFAIPFALGLLPMSGNANSRVAPVGPAR